MRFATLLTVPALLTALTAQEFTAEQRAELRQIIREEIRAAVKELHRAPPASTRTDTSAKAGETGDRTTGVRLLPPRVGAFEGLGQGTAVQRNDGQVTFGWTTVAPGGELEKSAGKNVAKPALKRKDVVVFETSKGVEIDVTTGMKPITHIREIEGGKLLQLLERVSEGPATTQRSYEVIEAGPDVQVVLRSLGHETGEKAGKEQKADSKKAGSKKADSKKAEKQKAKKQKKAKKAKKSKRSEKTGTLVFSTEGQAPRLIDISTGLVDLSSAIRVDPRSLDVITFHGTATTDKPDQGKTACCEACEAPACCEAPKAAPAPKATKTKQLLR